jgi:alpha/beta superfamily hydrolase
MPRVERLPPPPESPVRSPPVVVRGEVEAWVQGPAGTLEARVHVPASPRRVVVIAHPHPLYGGSMHSPVPLSIAKTLADRASEVVAWARFDFRGVGGSEGTYDAGRGEVDDALAVLEHLRVLAPGLPVSLCGHSFGSWIALRAAAAAGDGVVERVLLVAPSTRFFESWDDALPFAGPKTIFLGDRDEFCDVDEGRALADRLGAELRIFEGFDHHFTKSRRAVAEAALPVIAPEA